MIISKKNISQNTLLTTTDGLGRIVNGIVLKPRSTDLKRNKFTTYVGVEKDLNFRFFMNHDASATFIKGSIYDHNRTPLLARHHILRQQPHRLKQ